MAKIPYGIEADSPSKGDAPWTRLATIAEHLQDGEQIPPFLAHWLGDAIFRCEGDAKKLLLNLGLAKSRGRQPTNKDAWLVLGRELCQLENDGRKPEEAIKLVQERMTNEDSNGGMQRTQLARLRDEYRKVEQEFAEWEKKEGLRERSTRK